MMEPRVFCGQTLYLWRCLLIRDYKYWLATWWPAWIRRQFVSGVNPSYFAKQDNSIGIVPWHGYWPGIDVILITLLHNTKSVKFWLKKFTKLDHSSNFSLPNFCAIQYPNNSYVLTKELYSYVNWAMCLMIIFPSLRIHSILCFS